MKIHSDFAEAHYNLGNVLGAQGRHREAETSYRRALALKPTFAEAHCNLGNTLMDLGQLAEAETACRQALTLNPELAEAHNSLGKNPQGARASRSSRKQLSASVALQSRLCRGTQQPR
ncbi:MAG: tetratricopeptide repeat protein [Candidatus Accumulibacter sp.]|nr:tetratricopeptide repeat protein [Accumulibacter sp.]